MDVAVGGLTAAATACSQGGGGQLATAAAPHMEGGGSPPPLHHPSGKRHPFCQGKQPLLQQPTGKGQTAATAAAACLVCSSIPEDCRPAQQEDSHLLQKFELAQEEGVVTMDSYAPKYIHYVEHYMN